MTSESSPHHAPPKHSDFLEELAQRRADGAIEVHIPIPNKGKARTVVSLDDLEHLESEHRRFIFDKRNEGYIPTQLRTNLFNIRSFVYHQPRRTFYLIRTRILNLMESGVPPLSRITSWTISVRRKLWSVAKISVG